MNLNGLKRLIRESKLAGHAYVLHQRITQKTGKPVRTVVFFPKELYSGTGADLRVRAVSRELRPLGWRTIVVPPWLSLEERRSLLRKEPGAILFFHQCRHEFNLPQLYPDHLSVIDSDDADILHMPERFTDALRATTAVITGGGYLAELCRPYNEDVSVVWTGTYLTEIPKMLPKPAKPVIAWASRGPFDYPEECALMMRVWVALAERGIPFVPAIYTNERERAMEYMDLLLKLGIEVSIRPLMRFKEFVESLTDVSIGLHPVCAAYAFSRGKSFGKVLSYMVAQVPIIASDEIDHRLYFRQNENGILVDTEQEWIDACVYLLESPTDGKRMAEAAYADLLQRLTTRRAAELVHEVLERVAKKLPATV